MNYWVGRNQGGYYLQSLISIDRILGILWFVQRVGFAPVPTHWMHSFLSLPLFGMLAIANSGTSDKPRLPFVWCSWGWVYFLIVLCYCNYARRSWKIKRTVGRLVDGKGWSWNLSYISYGGLQFWNAFLFFCLLTLVHKPSPPNVDHQWWTLTLHFRIIAQSTGRSEALIHPYLRLFEHVRSLKDWRLHRLKLHGHYPHLQQEGSLAEAVEVLQEMCRVEKICVSLMQQRFKGLIGWILKTASVLNEAIHLQSLDWVVFFAWGNMSNRCCRHL